MIARLLNGLAVVLLLAGCVFPQAKPAPRTQEDIDRAKLASPEFKRKERENYQRYLKEQEEEQAKREAKLASYPPDVAELCRAGKVRLGMTEEQCETSWGPPEKKRETKYTWGTTAQWVYSAKNLYFKNGILETIQDR